MSLKFENAVRVRPTIELMLRMHGRDGDRQQATRSARRSAVGRRQDHVAHDVQFVPKWEELLIMGNLIIIAVATEHSGH